MTDLIEFLQARIAEDEAAIGARGHFPHSIHSQDPVGEFSPKFPDCLGLPGKARVLAECAAKRAVIAEHRCDDMGTADWCETCADWLNSEMGEGPPGVEWPCPTIKAIAAIYSTHPEYQQEWAA